MGNYSVWVQITDPEWRQGWAVRTVDGVTYVLNLYKRTCYPIDIRLS